MPAGSDEELASRLVETINHVRAICSDADRSITPMEEAAMERWVQLSIQLCIDIGDRVIAARKITEPPTARELFLLLGQIGVLPRQVGLDFAEFAYLRNAIVHDYITYSGPGIVGEASRILPS